MTPILQTVISDTSDVSKRTRETKVTPPGLTALLWNVCHVTDRAMYHKGEDRYEPFHRA